MSANDLPDVERLLAEGAWLQALARRLVADPGTADDVAQDATVIALTRPPRDQGALRGWLRRVVRNLSTSAHRDTVRRDALAAASARGESAEDTAVVVARWEVRRQVVEAVLALDEPYRGTLLLRFFEGLSLAEVAAREGVPVDTVKTRQRRALDMLRARLAHLADDGDRRGLGALFLLVEPDTSAVPAAGAGLTGALAMTLAQKFIAAAVLLAVGAGAWIAFRSPGAESPPEVARTGTAGAVETAPRAARSKRAAAEPAAAATSESRGDVPPPVDLDRCDRDIDLHGTVVDGEGKAVPGADIKTVTYPWRGGSGQLNAEGRKMEAAGPATRSSSDGTFAVRLGRGETVNLRVAAAGFAPLEMPNVTAGGRVRVTLRPGVRLVVVLKDAAGAPAADAVVDLQNNDRGGEPVIRARGTSGVDGICTLDDLPPGLSAYLTVEHASGYGGWSRVDLPDTGELRHEIQLPTGRTLTGLVVDARTNKPIAGARVGMSWDLVMAVTTQADGRYELPGWTGKDDEDVQVLAAGHGRGVKVVGAAERVDFALQPGYAVSGRVVSAEGAPVAGALLGIIASHPLNQVEQISTGYATSDALGAFRISGLTAAMQHFLIVTAPGRGSVHVLTPRSWTHEDVDLGDVTLPVSRRVEGVFAASDGTPQSRARVVLRDQVPDDSYGLAPSVFTDDLGRFRFADVGPGVYTIEAKIPGAPDVTTQVTVPADADVLGVRLSRAATHEVVGTVVDSNGAPVAGASLNVSGAPGGNVHGTTDAKGVARLQVPAASGMSVTIGLVQEEWKRFLQPKPRPLGAEERSIAIVLELGAVVSGRLVDPDGAAVAGAQFELRGSGDERWTGETADDGSFRVLVRGAARPAFVFAGTLMPNGRNQGGVGVDSGLLARVDGVTPGIELTVRCEREPRDRSLVVLVRSPQGAPVPGASVSLAAGVTRLTSGTTNAAGRVAFEKLPARELDMWVWLENASDEFLPPVRSKLMPEGQEVTRAFRAASRTSGVVTLDDGTGAKLCIVKALRDGTRVDWRRSSETGEFTVLLPVDDTAPFRIEVDTDLDGKSDAALDGVIPGTQGVRIVVKKARK